MGVISTTTHMNDTVQSAALFKLVAEAANINWKSPGIFFRVLMHQKSKHLSYPFKVYIAVLQLGILDMASPITQAKAWTNNFLFVNFWHHIEQVCTL